MTLEQAATALTIGKTKLFELLKSGELTTRYIGRRRVVSCADLERFIEGLPTHHG